MTQGMPRSGAHLTVTDLACLASLGLLSSILSSVRGSDSYLISSTPFFFFLFFFFGLFAFSRAAPAAYGGSQARSLIGAVAAGLRQSHSNVGSEPRLQPTPQLTATTDPLTH